MSDGSMEYEFTPVMSHHGSQTFSGPPGSRPSRCPYAASGRRFMDLPASYTPSWQPSPLQNQRWTPHVGQRPSPIPPTRFSEPITNINNLSTAGLSSPGAYPNYISPAPAPLPRPQHINPPPSLGSAAAATDSTQEDSQTSSPQVRVPATHVSLGTPLGGASTSTAASGSGAGSSPLYTPTLTNLGQREGQNRVNPTGASGQSVSVRLPVPTGHSHYSRPTRPRLSSGRSTLSEALRGESSRVTTDGSGPNTSSSDDDSDSELGPRLRFAGYPHSTRQSQILRGQMTNKRVASKKAIQSLQEVDMATLSESEKTCVICYNDFGVASPEGAIETPLRLPKCKHVFGNQCIRKWLEESYSCPYCRDQLDSELAKPNEAALRRMLAATGEPEMLLTHSAFRRMVQSYIRGDRDSSTDRAQVSFRRRRDHDLSDTPPANNRDGATRGERRALPEDLADAQRRQRPRHDDLHSSRPSIAPPEPSFLSGNRHGSSMATLQSQSPAREHFRFGSWQLSQQADPSRQSLPPQLPQPSRFSYSASGNPQVQAPMTAPLSLPQLHMMGLSYPHSVSGPYNNPLPPVTSREGGYPQTAFQPISPSPSAHMYGYPSGYMNPVHPPLPGRELQYPSFSPLSPLTDPPPHLPFPEIHHGNTFAGASQPPPNVTQPDRNGEGQHIGVFSPPS